ncbi:hypothetical protein JIQ42_05536 [Leishmania sp. Namibia]|uniref:hypothetical protein n=1 Tax=Leishmania sp. Namibia TaxID=2802991 RepID=UPI001B59B0B3|nr:hypothetical protein JIQ42_05536 [Leishmania sp. Namibia]
MLERFGRCAVLFHSNPLDFVVQSVPAPYLHALLLTAPLLIGLLRVVRPLFESWIMSSFVRIGGTAGGLSHIHRNIIVQLPPFFFVDVPHYNILLQNAVAVYVCHHLWRQTPPPPRLLSRTSQTVELIDPYRTWNAHASSASPFNVGVCSIYGRSLEDHFTEKVLHRLLIVKMPKQSWMPVMSDDIEIYFNEEPLPMKNYSREWIRRTLSLRCPAKPGAAAKLDGFVQRALEVFAEGAPGKEEDDGARWFFTYGGESGDKMLFNQYVLRSNKDFTTLFFPQRDATLALIDQFMQRRGRFAVEGFPQRLGFLVYGPPGTGRHTFVKALAAYTGRHIVSVPLSRLRTNQQLYDIFFVREFQSEERGGAQKLRMEDVIFLFDDVNAADPVVCARAARRVVQRRAAARLTARAGRREAPLTNCVIEMDTSSSQPVVRVEDSALPLALLLEMMGGGAAPAAASGASEDGGAPTEGGRRRRARKRAAASSDGGADVVRGNLRGLNDTLFGESKDKLDLAGLLNVLDGVVDMPGRMVVMITEHPEWLDPALIRPGRFSVRLRLDYMEMEALVQMLGLYYGDVAPSARSGVEAVHTAHRELSAAQVARVHAVVAALEAEAAAVAAACKPVADGGGNDSTYRFQVTPSEVEMLCMEQDDLDGFLTQLAGVVRGTVQL